MIDKERLTALIEDPLTFIQRASGLRLRKYQIPVVMAVVESVTHQQGHTIVVMFPRQSGKNELQAQLECYLLALFGNRRAEIVKVSPTWKPQCINAMHRLQMVLEKNRLLHDSWQRENGYIYRVNKARVIFFSGQAEANIVGATANTLLEVDEAQDVLATKFDRDIAPMAASTNATRVFWGTAWTSRTLLARELRAARKAEQADGIQRVFTINADQVGEEVPLYAAFVAAEVARLGRGHSMVKTQYFGEEIDEAEGLFPPARKAMMLGQHPAQSAPMPGARYAFLLDVAGQDELASRGPQDGAQDGALLANPGRDSTALTIVQIDPATLADPLIRAATYRVVARHMWTGERHTLTYARLQRLVEIWRPETLVVDATGVGAGLSSFLEKAHPGRVLPFNFNAASKSKLGWDFLTVCDSGRFQDHAGEDALKTEFWRQVSFLTFEAGSGPDKKLRWGVPDGTRDPADGGLVHDDLVISAALCALLDGRAGGSYAPGLLVQGVDPLKNIDEGGF